MIKFPQGLRTGSHASLQCYTVCPNRGKTVRDEDCVMTTIAPDARMADAQRTYPPRAAVVSWIFFDWAAQPYFTLITTFVFAPYFATHVASDPAEGQSLWGFATAAAGMLIALLSPVLGALADAAGRRKPWIAAFRALPVI